MNLYLVSQEVNENYDTYDKFIISCYSEMEAKHTHPDGQEFDLDKCLGCAIKEWNSFSKNNWVNYDNFDKITVKLIGVSRVDKGIVMTSFRAG